MLDSMTLLQAESAKLQQVFNEFDLDGSGQLDRREMARLINRLMPDLDSRCYMGAPQTAGSG